MRSWARAHWATASVCHRPLPIATGTGTDRPMRSRVKGTVAARWAWADWTPVARSRRRTPPVRCFAASATLCSDPNAAPRTDYSLLPSANEARLQLDTRKQSAPESWRAYRNVGKNPNEHCDACSTHDSYVRVRVAQATLDSSVSQGGYRPFMIINWWHHIFKDVSGQYPLENSEYRQISASHGWVMSQNGNFISQLAYTSSQEFLFGIEKRIKLIFSKKINFVFELSVKNDKEVWAIFIKSKNSGPTFFQYHIATHTHASSYLPHFHRWIWRGAPTFTPPPLRLGPGMTPSVLPLECV